MQDSGVLSFLCSCFLIVSTTFAESSFTEKCLLVASECQRYGYEVSRFPNVNKDQDTENARKAMWTYDALYQQSSPDCKTDIKLILCLVYFPLCLETNSVPAGPCAPLCSSTTMRCNVLKHGFGHPLASSLNCNSLPAVSSDSRPCVNSTDDGHEKLLHNKRIVMLEAGPAKRFTVNDKFSNRTCTLSPATIELFENVGAWEEIENQRCQQVLRMQVWESCSNSLITFNQANLADELAYVAENDVILEAINRRLDVLKDRVDVMYNTRSEAIEIPGVSDNAESNTWVKLKLNNGKTLKTKLLIGSDGMNSAVRKAANFHTVSFKYNQMAVVAVMLIDEMTNTVAWQRFLPTGPIAMLPMSDKACSLIWTTTPEEAKRLKSLTEEEFVDAVNDAFVHERDINRPTERVSGLFQNLLQNVFSAGTPIRQLPPHVSEVQAGSRASFPLGLTHSSNYVRHRVALIGDAAHRLHPLAGQGVNLGFGDVAKLAEVITKAVQDGSDPGSLSYLKEYETSRQRKVVPVMATIDGLQRLYGTDMTGFVMLRSLGLQAVNALGPLKDKIMHQASN